MAKTRPDQIATLTADVKTLRAELDQAKKDLRELELSDARTGVFLGQLEKLWEKFDALMSSVGELTTATAVQEIKIYAIAIVASAVLSALVSLAVALVT